MPRSGPGSAGTGFPSMSNSPRVGFSTPNNILRNVVLPQPEAPTMVTNSPSAIVRFRFSSTTCWPYSFHSRLTVTVAIDLFGLRPGKEAITCDAQQPIHGEREQRDPDDVRQNHVHGHVAPNEEDAIPQSFGRSDRFGGNQKQPRATELQANRIDESWPELRQNDSCGKQPTRGAQRLCFDQLLSRQLRRT